MSTRDSIVFAGFLWVLYAALPALVTFPIVFGFRRRVRWHAWEILAFILPFGLWLWLWSSEADPTLPKGLGNLIEPFYVGLGIPCAALIRSAAGRTDGATDRLLAFILLVSLCGLAAAVYFLTPAMEAGLKC